LMNHLKKVKDVSSPPPKTWQGQSSQLPADNFVAAHQRKVAEENGPKTYSSTKLLGARQEPRYGDWVPKGVKTDNYMMTFTAQLEKERKPGVSSIGMVPKVNGSIEMEFLKKVEEQNKPGESSVGMAPKMPADSYMTTHSAKIKEDQERMKMDDSKGATTHMPHDSYMQQHFKSATETLHLGKLDHAKAALPPDSFLIQFHKTEKEANAVKPIPHKQGHMPADAYYLSHLKKVNDQKKMYTSTMQAMEKPSVGTDDFTMSVMRKAQKDVMSY